MLDFNTNNQINEYFDKIRILLFEDDKNIKYYGNYKKREERILGNKFIPRMEINDYTDNFHLFPFHTLLPNIHTKVTHYFYEYYLVGRRKSEIIEMDKEDIDYLFNQEIPEHAEMNPAVFLYNAILSQYDQITELYPDSLSSITSELRIEATDEKTKLINSIEVYVKILEGKEEQLNIFRGVIFHKEIADLYTKILIEFLHQRLITIDPSQKNIHLGKAEEDHSLNLQSNSTYQLPENFSLTKEKIKASNLDIRQIALLFYYLRKKEAIINYTDASLAKFVHYLTGHSESNLRQKKGFGNIITIENETREDQKFYNIKKLKSLLKDIISDIDKKIDSN